MESEDNATNEVKWYAISLVTVLIFSSVGHHYVDSEVIRPQLYDGSVVELGRYTFTSDAYDFISERENHSVIALGSSKMREGFNGLDLEEQSQFSGIEFFNLAIAGERPYYRMIEIEKIINSNPDLVVLELGPSSFSKLGTPIDESSVIRMNSLIRQQSWSPNPSWKGILEPEDMEVLSLDFLERIEHESYYSFSAIEETLADAIYPEESGFSCDDELSNIRCVPSTDSDLYLDYLKYPVQFRDYLGTLRSKGPDSLAEFYGPTLDNYLLSSLHNPEGHYNKNHRAYDFIIDELAQNDIEVLLVALPYNPVMLGRLGIGQWDYYNSSVSNYSNDSRVHLLDLMWSNFDSDYYFNDFSHLSSRGETLLTDLLIPEIDHILSGTIEDFVFDQAHNYTIRNYSESILGDVEQCSGSETTFPISSSTLIAASEFSSCIMGDNGHAWVPLTSNAEGTSNPIASSNGNFSNFDLNSDDWSNQSSGSVLHLSDTANSFDSGVLKLVSDGTGPWLGRQSEYSIFDEGEKYIISADLFIPDEWDGGSIYLMDGSSLADNDEEYYHASPTIFDDESNKVIPLTNQWQKVETVMEVGSDQHGRYYLRTTVAPSSGKFVLMDNFSIERIHSGHNNLNHTTILKALPDENKTFTIPPSITFELEVSSPENYSFWFRIRGPDGNSDSIHIQIDGVGYTYGGRGLSSGSDWSWKNSGVDIEPISPFLDSGEHELTVIMREDGVELSHIFIGTGSEMPPGME